MPKIFTQYKNYPLPHPDNYLSDDVKRIGDAFSQVDSDMNGLDKKQHSQESEIRKMKLESFIGLGVTV